MQSILKSLRSVLRVLIIVGLGYFLSLEGFITGYIYVPLIVFILAVIVDKTVYARRFPKNSAENFSAKEILLYALPITGFLVLYQAMVSLNLFIVKAVLQDDYLTGIFNGAFTISQIPNYLFYALTIVLLPVVSHSMADKNNQKTIDAISTSLRMMTLLLIPVVALIMAYAEPLMVFFFGSQFSGGAAVLQVLAFGLGLLTLFYVMSSAFQGAGLVQIPLRIAIFGTVLNAALNLILVSQYKLIGSAIATCVTAIFVIGVFFYHLKNEFKITLKISSLFKMILAGLIIFGLSFFLPGGHLLFIPFGALLFCIYLGILYLFKEINESDRSMIKSMIPGLRKKA